eukprot:CAMPEP_0117489304 /NCGR_PEP_ID=MMETSP0784-20121206/16965_1 /TAXON_ID=39447 /ORGANISM="" /LENGTH=129 /DNA_ID=CAMNT_0005284025 /DNA_START=23 /DNA_END=412 /DNA_ORIENTATION=-
MAGDPLLTWVLLDVGLVLYIIGEALFTLHEAKPEENLNAQMDLKSVNYVSLRQETDDQAEPSSTCAICLEDFGEEEQVVVLRCKHVFHTGCMDMWLLNGSGCPLRCDAKATLLTRSSEMHIYTPRRHLH